MVKSVIHCVSVLIKMIAGRAPGSLAHFISPTFILAAQLEPEEHTWD